jgi:hypothetical protein
MPQEFCAPLGYRRVIGLSDRCICRDDLFVRTHYLGFDNRSFTYHQRVLEPHRYLCGYSRHSPHEGRFHHSFVKDRGDYAAVDDILISLEDLLRHELAPNLAVKKGELEMKTRRILLSAHKTVVIVFQGMFHLSVIRVRSP